MYIGTYYEKNESLAKASGLESCLPFNAADWFYRDILPIEESNGWREGGGTAQLSKSISTKRPQSVYT
jgi:hypothetical protein